MSLEQTIRDTLVSESMDLDARLQQLVRAGLMPQNTLPLLRRAVAKVQMGASLQGPERDVMATFINSMMYIVLGDDTIFNKARAGAKSYAAEETEDEQVARLKKNMKSRDANLKKKYGGLAKIGSANKKEKADYVDMKTVREAKEKQEYDYEGDMAMSQLKSIIANSQKMHDMLGADTNLPEWVQSKITLAEDYITTAANYMQGEMSEAVGDYTVKTVSPADAYKKHTGQMTKKNKVPVDPKTGKTLYQKVTSEEVEDLEETAKIVAHLQKRYGDNIRKSHVASAAKDFGVDASKLSKAVRKKLGKSMLDEEEQIDEISKKTLASYSDKAVRQTYGNQPHGKDALRKRTNREKGVKAAYNKFFGYKTKVPATEETQLDELSNKTLSSYAKKAVNQSFSKGVAGGAALASTSKETEDQGHKLVNKAAKRMQGAQKAISKLTKESRKADAGADIAAIKQMNESYKTTFNAALETYGIKSPSELDEEKRKEFFNHVDQNYKKGDK